MRRVEWSDTANADLRNIREYIARDSPDYARRIVDRIRVAVARCRRFPLAAARIPEWDRADLRETFVASYRVMYTASCIK